MSEAEVIGLGRSGIAAAKLLNKNGWQVTLSDSASPDKIASRPNAEVVKKSQQELVARGITVKLGSNIDLDRDNLPDLIVVSPGVPWDIPGLVAARNLGIETIGEMELAWHYLKDIPWIAITGTNGKTTTTALIAAIFEAAGIYAPACGTIGYAACELALQDKKPDWVIAEISSYQSNLHSRSHPRSVSGLLSAPITSTVIKLSKITRRSKLLYCVALKNKSLMATILIYRI